MSGSKSRKRSWQKKQKEEMARKQEEKEAIAEFVTMMEYSKMMEDALGAYLAQDDGVPSQDDGVLQDDGVPSQDDRPRMDRQKWISTMQ